MKPRKMKVVKKKATKKASGGPSWQQVSNHQDAGLDVILERLDEIKALLVSHAGTDGPAPEPEKVNESEMPEAPAA
jgi:hypothetical protein